MTNSCNKLMMDAIQVVGHEFKGIELNYKLNEVLGNLKPSMKFTSEQLKGYLLKQGVSPNEITASKIFEGFEKDNRALTISEWSNFGGNQQLQKRTFEGNLAPYEDVTLGRKGSSYDFLGNNNPTYKVNEFLSNKQKLGTNLRHKMDYRANRGESNYSDFSQLGWNRVHQDTINGKPTTVLNELQSDWMQAERQGAGIFESKANGFKPKYTEQELQQGKLLYSQAENIANKYGDNFWEEVDKGNPEALEAARLFDEAQSLGIISSDDIINNHAIKDKIIADFPLKPEKFQQLMIVDALNEAITNGTNRVAIPTIRHNNELVGTEGVTKFYQDLNKKVLPDIRSKLEKQGLRVKLSSEDYLVNKPVIYKNFISDMDEYIYDRGYTSPNEIFDSIKEWEKLNSKITSIDELNKWAKSSKYSDAVEEFLSYIGYRANKLHILEVEEVPNAKVKWNVYGLLSSIGLGAYTTKGEASDSLVPNKAQIETSAVSKPMVEEPLTIMYERPEIVKSENYSNTNSGIKSYIAKIESSGHANPYIAKNKNTGAEGKYQILPSNYVALSKSTGIPMNRLTAPHNQEKVMDYLVGEYKSTLDKWKLPITKENIFALHNLGQEGGARVLRGTYTQKDINNMKGQLPPEADKSNNMAIIANYSARYNIEIPTRRDRSRL